MTTPNIIIFSDDTGIGVQVGEEQVYIETELKNAINKDYNDIMRKLSMADREINRLGDKIQEMSDKCTRYEIVASIIAGGRDEWGC